jgi:phosphatidylserine/phosphatidylglycerophosphate/cardiolipin synthase-like enzyme
MRSASEHPSPAPLSGADIRPRFRRDYGSCRCQPAGADAVPAFPDGGLGDTAQILRNVIDAQQASQAKTLNMLPILSGAAWLAKNGVPVWIDRSVAIAHNKLILIDRDTVVMGSLNWTKAGNTKNAENMHVIRGASELAGRHEAYFKSREVVSELYKAALPGPQGR